MIRNHYQLDPLHQMISNNEIPRPGSRADKECNENSDDNTSCSNTFEWCNEGITPEKDVLQNVSYITDIPGWPQVYNEKGVFYCTDITQLAPQFRAILEPQGIKSMLQCAITD